MLFVDVVPWDFYACETRHGAHIQAASLILGVIACVATSSVETCLQILH